MSSSILLVSLLAVAGALALPLDTAAGSLPPATPLPRAAELRRWEGSHTCEGNYTVLNSDVMGSCTKLLIPAPASIKVEYKNTTVYSSYHYQFSSDCETGLFTHNRTQLGDFVVETCEDLSLDADVFSQMRVWLY